MNIDDKKEFDKTIALVAGSYKPPHAGHLDMIQQYSKLADEVVVLISDPKSKKSIRTTKNGTIITPEMSKQIWEIYLSRYGLSNKVKVLISSEPSPITAMFNYIDDNLHDVNVVLGVSRKMDKNNRASSDINRFSFIQKYVDQYYNDRHVKILDPYKTSVKPLTTISGEPISATDIRDNIDDFNKIKLYLPNKLTDDDIKKIIDILSGNTINECMVENLKIIKCKLNDQILNASKIACYNSGITITDTETGEKIPMNPKKVPDRAIEILINSNPKTFIYFDTKTKCWDSSFTRQNDVGSVYSPEQMEGFFNSGFFNKLVEKLQQIWPTTDPFFNELFQGVIRKQLRLGYEPPITEDTIDAEEAPEEKEYSATGRKIVHFNNSSVNSNDAEFYCWPAVGKEYSWSTWKDWKKIRPLCRMRFKHSKLWYGVSLSPVADNYQNRGFRAYDLTTQPPLQWLSKPETANIVQLNLVKKFIKQCIKRLSEYTELMPQDIYDNINNPDKITLDEISQTQRIIKNTLDKIVKKHQIDSFKWK